MRSIVSTFVRTFVFSIFLVVATYDSTAAQEFNCNVRIDYRLLTGNDFTFLNELQQRIDEYINDRIWTEDTFIEHERIECTIQVTLEEALTLTSFRGRLILATRRPIYGTTQSTTVIQINDSDWQFNYSQGTPLVFNLERYDPLTTILDFYAYLMLGYDYDTFSEMGGTKFFDIARRIAERAEANGAQGWSQIGTDQGRAQLITQLRDPRFAELRAAYYNYHFLGLDRFLRETEEARNTILSVLTTLEQLRQEVSRSYAEDLFFSTKYQELAAVFDDSELSVQAYRVLSQVDPAHLSEYNRLTQ